MLIVKTGYVRHNGKTYVVGEPLPEMDSKAECRLLDLGVCALVHDAPSGANQEDTGEESGEQEENSTGGGNEPQGAVEEPVELNINPEESIKRGTKK